jgi:carbonic anhydrase
MSPHNMQEQDAVNMGVIRTEVMVIKGLAVTPSQISEYKTSHAPSKVHICNMKQYRRVSCGERARASTHCVPPKDVGGALRRRECVQLALSVLLLNHQFPPYAVSKDAWTYERTGAWGGVCQSGSEQSPVALGLSVDERKGAAVVAGYEKVEVGYSTRSDGCPQIDVRRGEAWIDVDGIRHKLVQIHWHAPAEHSLGSRGQSDMEAHFVHEPPLVLALMLSASPGSTADPLLDAVLGPGRHDQDGQDGQELELSGAVPTGPVVEYRGSLTTPPCTEGVVWLVDPRPRPMSREQLAAFLALRGPVGNARPQVGANARHVVQRRVEMSER